MAWTDPKNWVAGDALTAAILNTHLKDNLNALKDPPSNKYTFNDSADWQTTSTSWVDIDATDLSLTIVPSGGDVLVHFHGTVSPSTQVLFDFTIDGTRHGGDDGLVRAPNTLSIVSFTMLVEGLSAVSHTFKLQWKLSSAGSATLYAGAGTANNDLHGQFWVREVS